MYIPNHKYQVKPHLCLWFSVACDVAIGHRYHFYCFYHYNRSSESRGMSDRPVIVLIKLLY